MIGLVSHRVFFIKEHTQIFNLKKMQKSTEKIKIACNQMFKNSVWMCPIFIYKSGFIVYKPLVTSVFQQICRKQLRVVSCFSVVNGIAS